MANLPAELVDEILLRLPVKPLLRFRCVSKRWLDLIDSPNFIKLHVNRSIETRNNRTIMVREQLRTSLVNVDSADIPVGIDHPLKNSHIIKQWERSWFKGSCNGLILISYHGVKHVYDEINVIWNPSTRNYHILPLTGFAEFDSHVVVDDDDDGIDYVEYGMEYVVYGMGYDSVHDDYKVVRMIMFDKESDGTWTTKVKVYSLKSNMWRKIQDFPHYFYVYECHGMLSGGALHWLVYENYRFDDPFIAAFDLATEEYHRLIPMPPNIEKFGEGGERLEVLEGCLSICNRLSDRIDVWVMKRYGVRESWTKLISIGLLYAADPYYYNFIIPLALSKDGTELLFMHSGRVLNWVDLQRKIARIDVHGFSRNFLAEFVVQSLVPLDSGSRRHVQDQRKRKWIEVLD